MMADEPFGGARHRFAIERARNLPGAVEVKRQRGAAVDDAVVIDACGCRTPRIEIRRHLLRRKNGYPVRAQMGIHRIA